MIVAELAKLSHRRACVRAATLALWTVLILFFGAQRSALGAYVATFEVEQATVIVQGAEVGTGFAILNRGDYTYFLTAAHLIARDAYALDAALPPAERKPKTAWLTVYDPKDGSAHDATILGSADFASDIVVVRVEGLTHHPRAMCLAAGLPFAAPFIVSSFEVNVIQNPTGGVPFDNEHATLAGSEGTFPPVQNRPYLFQYSAPEEVGFSGSPLVDSDTGAVFGMAEGGPMVVNATTGQTVVSTVTRIGVSTQAIRDAIDKAKVDDPALADFPVIVESDRTNMLPNLTLAGRRLRIIAFDQPLNGSNPKDLFAAYASYDSAIRRVIKEEFRQADASPILDRVTAVFPINTDIRRIPNLCLTADFQQAAGVIGIRRSLTSAPGTRQLESRVGLISCRGHVIDSADVANSQMGGAGPDPEQIAMYATNLRTALRALAGVDGTRLTNFAADGLPLGDGENRGFYSVRHKGSTTWLGYSWAEGEAADYSHLYVDQPINSIQTMSAQQLSGLSSETLDSALDHARGALAVKLGDTTGELPNVRPELRTADRCFYFWRLFRKNNDEIPAAFDRKETI